MFRANFFPSSGAQDLDFLQHMVQYPVMWYAGVSERVVWHYVYFTYIVDARSNTNHRIISTSGVLESSPS
jgi:hypothetical protein